MYLLIDDEFAQHITNHLNKLFGKNQYLFQNNYPIRISYDLSKGTPIHQDSQSIIIDKQNKINYKNGSYKDKSINKEKVLIEVEQDKKIFNINYIIYEENINNTMRICESKIQDIRDKSYFYRIKQNKKMKHFYLILLKHYIFVQISLKAYQYVEIVELFS